MSGTEQEQAAAVARYDHHTPNPRVDYSLTPAGRDLLATVHQLCTWSRAHLRELLDGAPERAGA
ncbi:DNA-binding HxlR family transcriptional regulator [Nocardia kruczakiae]|uniref:DNA-binding HxlR family transcriptional regulator n=1 Tax=Nocardia kruczakiae TaxID=261477 RepID=A0ABU1XBU5_9NOCA|nr:winged helix-turn-helix transcriptional regulator [Nocardia kruczakiae]MDR7168001.1 DNA-binding HxlR family transcriptional regulator [Nocardia kruczakiae]